MDQKEFDMELLKMRLEMLRQLWQRLLKQGVLVSSLFAAVVLLGWVVYYLDGRYREDIKALRLEYKDEVADVRNQLRACEQDRIEQAAIFNEALAGMKQELASVKGTLAAIRKR